MTSLDAFNNDFSIILELYMVLTKQFNIMTTSHNFYLISFNFICMVAEQAQRAATDEDTCK